MNKKITFLPALLTAVGFCIGSGIFFRANSILVFTQGNISIAILGWFTLGFTLIFSGIAMSILANRTRRDGGIVAYLYDNYGEKASFAAGWFLTFLYTPILVCILALVASTYFHTFMSMELTNPSHFAIGGIFIACTWGWNYFSAKFAAYFSSASTVIKMLPIIVIGTLGISKVDVEVVSSGFSAFEMGLFTAPLLSMGFAFNGWTDAGSLSRDLENPQKDMARIFAINAIIVTTAYVLYFSGMSFTLNHIWGDNLVPMLEEHGPAHVYFAAEALLGSIGAQFITLTVCISCLGTLNSLVMSSFRYPHALAQAKDLPKYDYFVQENKYGLPGRVGVLSLVAILIWFGIYFAQYHLNAITPEGVSHIFSGITFPDLPVVMMTVVVSLLMINVLRTGRKEGHSTFKSVICPLVGLVGQMFLLVSFVMTNYQWLTYTMVILVVIAIGFGVRMTIKRDA